eukprot:gene5037-8633_t
MDEEGGDENIDADDEELMQNTYYDAKGAKEDDVDEALELFQTVIDMEEEKGIWGFKALKQSIKLLAKHQRFDEIYPLYKSLLQYTKAKDVSKNDADKAINNVLNQISYENNNQKVVEKIYKVTLDKLLSENNEKLWFNTQLKFGDVQMEIKDMTKLKTILDELYKWCKDVDGTYDKKKSSQLLDCIVLDIQMENYLDVETKNHLEHRKRLKKLYQLAMKIMSGAVVLNPKNNGIIREAGGKMHMRMKAYKAAYGDFFEAFKSYDEAGSPKRIRCLKYLVISSMLMSKEGDIDVNPFEASEVKPYKNHTEIEAFQKLIQHFQKVNRFEFERVLRKNKDGIEKEEFIQEFMTDLMNTFRSKLLLVLIVPYTRMNLVYLSKELNVEENDIEKLCSDLILDGRLSAEIDQLNSRIVLTSKEDEKSKSMAKWANKLNEIHSSLLTKVN